MLKSVRSKILVFYTVLTLLVGAVFYLFFADLIKDTHLDIMRREMREKVRFIEMLFREEHQRYFASSRELQSITRELSKIIELRITIITLDGAVIADSSHDIETMDNHFYRKEVRESLKKGSGENVRYSNSMKKELLYYAKRSDGYIIRLSKDIHEISQSAAVVRRAVLVFTVFLLFLALLVNFIFSRVITRPIDETMRFAEGFASGDFSRRIFNYSDDEVGKLQKSLNRLADSLQDKINTLVIEQRKLGVTIQSITDGIAVIDGGKRIVVSNKAFISLLGIKTEAEGKPYFEVVRNSALNEKIEAVLSTGSPHTSELELPGGVCADMHIVPIKEEAAIQGILVLLHDITERKRIMQIKTDLVGNLSHELKTPITILKGYLETISQHLQEPETTRGFIEKALINVERQNAIINDMLKLNMLETSPFISSEKINLEEIIENCLDILAPKIGEKRITVAKDIGDLPAALGSNRFLAEEVFFNLLDNAVNYNRFDGSVRVSAGRSARAISIAVSDTGIGITEEHRARIFERFYRVSKSRSRVTGGTGLGLSIVKHAADLLHWNIAVTSGDTGSTFTIEIPVP